MVTLCVETDTKGTQNLTVDERGDVLSALDKFLKRNRLDLFRIRTLTVACGVEDSTRCRAARSAIAALQFFVQRKV